MLKSKDPLKFAIHTYNYEKIKAGDYLYFHTFLEAAKKAEELSKELHDTEIAIIKIDYETLQAIFTEKED